MFDETARPVGVSTPPRLEAHRLIEEFMIQANVATAQTLEARRTPFLRRVHDAPAAEKAEALCDYAASLGFSLPRGQTLTTTMFNRIVAQAEATPHAEAIAQAVLRAQSQALYAARDQSHFGLNLRRYAHFTSPIRRYADLIAHRALISALALGPDGNDRETLASMDDIADQISEAERTAMAAERATVDRLVAQILASQVGAAFAGRVAGIVSSGLFVELEDTKANGFVAAAALGRRYDDYFDFDEAGFAMRGRSSGRGYRIGEPVEIRLHTVEPLRGLLDFEMLTPPAPLPKPKRGAKRRAAPCPVAPLQTPPTHMKPLEDTLPSPIPGWWDFDLSPGCSPPAMRPR